VSSSRFDPTPYLAPGRCAVLVFECQQMVIGVNGPYRGLIESAHSGMLDRLAGLLGAARAAGVPVVYCNFVPRPGGLQMSKSPSADLARSAPAGAAGGAPPDVAVVPEVAPTDADLIVERSHGMSGFHGTELDTCLRALGVDTVLATGVSANLGVIGTVIEAYNHGYRVVVPADCVAADPPDYHAQMMRYSYRNIAYVTTSEAVVSAWAMGVRPPSRRAGG
jgi:nicotinamidase-related amidase